MKPQSEADLRAWAEEEVGHAQLGNKLRSVRLVDVLAQAAAQPDGIITAVFDDPADREGAYRLLENPKVSVTRILEAAAKAAALRSLGAEFAFVPVDGTSLSLPDYENRGMGSVGARNKGGTGLKVMNAIAVSPSGVPLGLVAQEWWVRGKPAKEPSTKRKLDQKETRFWLSAMSKVEKTWQANAPSVRPWFQLDREGDFRDCLKWAAETNSYVTVRATHDRRVLNDEEKYLWAAVESAPRLTTYELKVPAAPNRPARTATMEVRSREVSLRLKNAWTKTATTAPLWVVQAREVSPVPDGAEPLEWVLLTNRPAASAEDALLVLFGYTQRWRIEQHHRIWKETCRVEATQLREVDHIERWAVILAIVAMRILRLTYLSRVEATQPATVELSRDEIDVLIVAKGKGKYRLGETPSLAEATLMIALLGGYTSFKTSGGPPGAKVLARGLRRLSEKAEALTSLAEFRAMQRESERGNPAESLEKPDRR